jgi:serine/threonine protein kinase
MTEQSSRITADFPDNSILETTYISYLILQPLTERRTDCTVYLAEPKGVSKSQQVALKIFNSAEDELYDYNSEITFSQSVSHPFVRGFKREMWHISAPHLRIVEMHYFGERDLATKIQEIGYFEESRAILIMRRLAEAVKYVHGLCWVHNGIFPENIFLYTEDHPILMGFTQISKVENGIATQKIKRDLFDAKIEEFLAPEVRLAHCPVGTFASDIFALGKCFQMMVDCQLASAEVIDLIAGMTESDYTERPTIDEVVKSGAFSEINEEDVNLEVNDTELCWSDTEMESFGQ